MGIAIVSHLRVPSWSHSSNTTGTRTNNIQDHRVAMDTSDHEEIEKKIKGTQGYVFTMAASSLAWALALLPYWGICCSHITASIPKVWMDVIHIGYICLFITIVIVTAQSSRFKDGNLPDSTGFRVLQAVQFIVLLCLWAGTFIPQHVCRDMSNSVVWICASLSLFAIVLSWALVFQHKTKINCTKKAPCQMVTKCTSAPCLMVIKCTKDMHDEVQHWLRDRSLSECIKAKCRKTPKGESCSDMPTEPVYMEEP